MCTPSTHDTVGDIMKYHWLALLAGGVRASRFASSVYGAKVAVVELPFGFVSSETVGGAGGTYASLMDECPLS